MQVISCLPFLHHTVITQTQTQSPLPPGPAPCPLLLPPRALAKPTPAPSHPRGPEAIRSLPFPLALLLPDTPVKPDPDTGLGKQRRGVGGWDGPNSPVPIHEMVGLLLQFTPPGSWAGWLGEGGRPIPSLPPSLLRIDRRWDVAWGFGWLGGWVFACSWLCNRLVVCFGRASE